MVNELRAVVKELGGRSVLGRNLASQRDLREAIRDGFPPAVVDELMRPPVLVSKNWLTLSISPRAACSGGAAVDAWRASNPIAFIAWPALSHWRSRVWGTARVRRVG